MFSGAELILKDYESEEYHFSSVIVSTAVSSHRREKTGFEHDLIIITDQSSDVQRAIAKELSNRHPNTRVAALSDSLGKGSFL